MPARPVRRMTLRELLSESDRYIRETHDHLQMNLAPAVRELRKLVVPRKTQEVADITVHNAVDRALKSEGYAGELLGSLDELLQAICDHAKRESFGL